MNRTLLSAIAIALLAACSGDRSARDTAQSAGAVGTQTVGGDTARRDTTGPAPTPNVANKNPAKDAPPPGTAATSNSPQQTSPATTAPVSPGGLKTPSSTTTPPTAELTPAAGAGGGAPAAVAASPPPASDRRTAAPPHPPLPFSTGERLVYDVKFGPIDVGDATMQVLGVEDVRGIPSYHVLFNVKGGTFLYKVNDRYESWIDTIDVVSLRHWQSIDEGSYERERKYEILPGKTYTENDKPAQPTVAQPLDDGSFFFFLRTIPLEVGQTYSFNRYFKPDRNPVTVTVERKERVKVPAGTFDAIVLHPTIKAKGVFGEGGDAEIWLADDSTREMLQMKSKLKFGSLNLYLRQRTAGR